MIGRGCLRVLCLLCAVMETASAEVVAALAISLSLPGLSMIRGISRSSQSIMLNSISSPRNFSLALVRHCFSTLSLMYAGRSASRDNTGTAAGYASLGGRARRMMTFLSGVRSSSGIVHTPS